MIMAATNTTARTITIELPNDLVAALKSLEGIEDRAWKALVLDFLRHAEISQGRAAQLLGVTRYDILDLMAEHHILSGPLTSEEMERDIENAGLGSPPPKPMPAVSNSSPQLVSGGHKPILLRKFPQGLIGDSDGCATYEFSLCQTHPPCGATDESCVFRIEVDRD